MQRIYQQEMELGDLPEAPISIPLNGEICALEQRDFPFEVISEIAEQESWRKELNRPPYHIHKWWAQRLGTVFRAIHLGLFTSDPSTVVSNFYSAVRIPDALIFDPFMGSGTTLGEGAKLGMKVIGRDINPVAHFLVKNALSSHDRAEVLAEFDKIERSVRHKIRRYFVSTLSDGSEVDVLYYFWVKVVECPKCAADVDLFSSRIFASHAYPRKHPRSQATCPSCGEVNEVQYQDTLCVCHACESEFNPQSGNAKGQHATCPHCSNVFGVASTIRETGRCPDHRLYAKLVLKADGSKTYMKADDADIELYEQASRELNTREGAFPVVEIEPGYNTNQALGYNYRHWHEMFNDRQLLCLSYLADKIGAISSPSIKDLFVCLFSGALEFNNMFASFKGEGTGAVRHMFAHHVLKPERVPLEANLWGTPKSSGSFSSMFRGRILRALDYSEYPFELAVSRDAKNKRVTKKVFGLSAPLGSEVAETYSDFQRGAMTYISCGSSEKTDIPDKVVDAVVTDPPFFDNVHYSELADFFYVWQNHILRPKEANNKTTRSISEVQQSDANQFLARLQSVWLEANRVLKDDGVLAFTYHHSRTDGWMPVLSSLVASGFWISAVQPVKSEMAGAMPKNQAKEPINLDVIVVCRKRSSLSEAPAEGAIFEDAQDAAQYQISRFMRTDRKLSRNDVRVIFMSQLLRILSRFPDLSAATKTIGCENKAIEAMIDNLCQSQPLGG